MENKSVYYYSLLRVKHAFYVMSLQIYLLQLTASQNQGGNIKGEKL